jgi:hypothetical protein
MATRKTRRVSFLAKGIERAIPDIEAEMRAALRAARPSLAIVLPWPNRALWTNAKKREHWATVAQWVRAYRHMAKFETMAYRSEWPAQADRARLTLLRVEAMPPTKRRYDAANLLEACKPYADGICDALEIDDAQFVETTARKCAVVKGGSVRIVLGVAA